MLFTIYSSGLVKGQKYGTAIQVELAPCDRQAHFANHYRAITLKLAAVPYSAIENILSGLSEESRGFLSCSSSASIYRFKSCCSLIKTK